MTKSTTAEGFWGAAERAWDRIQAYFDARAKGSAAVPSQHDIDGIKQLISNAASAMSAAAEGKARAQEARDPPTYLATRIIRSSEDPRLTPSKRADRRLALEMLADELGIKDDVLRVITGQIRRSP
jgi:hypothetical protein